MKRVAIILGSPLEEHRDGYLPGVKKDVKNYRKFLLSATGGAWFENEIHIEWNITRDKLPLIQRLCADADMACLMCSAHGTMQNGKTYLKVNHNEFVGVHELETKAKRQITIIDSCRTPYPYFNDIGIYGISPQFDNTRPDIARLLYDYYVNQSGHGHITLYSSSPGQTSVDSRDGGWFSLTLLKETSSWSHRENGEKLSIHSAYLKCVTHLTEIEAEQDPEHKFTTDDSLRFPFALNVRAYLERTGKKNISLAINKNESSGFGKVVVGLAVIFTVGAIIKRLSDDD